MQTKFISWLIENPEIHQILASQWLELQASDLLHVLDQLHEGGFTILCTQSSCSPQMILQYAKLWISLFFI